MTTPDITRGKQTKHLEPWWFSKGKSGNPAGRPKGARHKFSEAFYQDFLADWEMAGREAIQACRLDDPAVYCRIAASLIPKQLSFESNESQVDTLLEQFSTDELQAFIAGLTAIGAKESDREDSNKALPRK